MRFTDTWFIIHDFASEELFGALNSTKEKKADESIENRFSMSDHLEIGGWDHSSSQEDCS